MGRSGRYRCCRYACETPRTATSLLWRRRLRIPIRRLLRRHLRRPVASPAVPSLGQRQAVLPGAPSSGWCTCAHRGSTTAGRRRCCRRRPPGTWQATGCHTASRSGRQSKRPGPHAPQQSCCASPPAPPRSRKAQGRKQPGSTAGSKTVLAVWHAGGGQSRPAAGQAPGPGRRMQVPWLHEWKGLNGGCAGDGRGHRHDGGRCRAGPVDAGPG